MAFREAVAGAYSELVDAVHIDVIRIFVVRWADELQLAAASADAEFAGIVAINGIAQFIAISIASTGGINNLSAIFGDIDGHCVRAEYRRAGIHR